MDRQAPVSAPQLGPSDMRIVERVLEMRGGYVLDFSDRTFDQFVAHEVGVDATAPRFSVDGGSKAKRLRRILTELRPPDLAKLLRALLRHRDGSNTLGLVEPLDEEWRSSYLEIVSRMERRVMRPAADAAAAFGGAPVSASSSWTGRRTIGQQIVVVRDLVPLASVELMTLVDLVDARRFNDPQTADALAALRELHAQLGELLRMAYARSLTRDAVRAVETNRVKLMRSIAHGAKLSVVAPALTFGVVHLLAWITGVAVDTTMVAGVYGTVVGADALTAHARGTGLGTDP